jgi:sirohydrochlorin cobaltochelatase
MADVLMARLRACLPDIGRWNVLLVGHGSARAPGRPMALHRHAVRLAAHGITARAAFLEEAPLVQDALAAWRCAPVAILGVFAGEGGHVRDDLPRLIAAERDARGASGQPLAALGSIGEEPGLRRLILDRIGGPPGKVG